MIKPKDKLKNCVGFQWDKGNATKNWDLHEVTQTECEQVFFNYPLIVRRDSRHSEMESRYYVLGRTNVGRLLFIPFTVRENLILVISARDMTPNEIDRYES